MGRTPVFEEVQGPCPDLEAADFRNACVLGCLGVLRERGILTEEQLLETWAEVGK